MSGAAMAIDQEGKMIASGFLGYTFGFGDAFEYIDAGLNFGGSYHYGITEKYLVGGELSFQTYKFDLGPLGDHSETELNILATALMDLNTTDEGGLFLTGGVGIYGGESSSFGINGGIVYTKAVAETIKLFGMPRLHIILDDNTPMMLSLSVGAQFGFGDRY